MADSVCKVKVVWWIKTKMSIIG